MNGNKAVACVAMALVLNILTGHAIHAWETDKLVYLNYFYVPDTGFKDFDGEIEMNSVQGTAVVPVGLSESMLLLPGVDYQGLFVDYKGIVFSEPVDGKTMTEDDLPEDVHAVDLVVGLFAALSDDWAAYFEFRPGIHSDMKDISGKDVYYQGGAVLAYTFSHELTAFLGAYHDDSFGEPKLYPVGGVQWQISDDFALDTLLPDYFLLTYEAAERVTFGLRGRLRGHQFRLDEFIWKDSVIKYEQILIGPCVNFLLTDKLLLMLEGGIVTAQEFEFRDDDSDEKLYDGDIKDGGYCSVSLTLQY